MTVRCLFCVSLAWLVLICRQEPPLRAEPPTRERVIEVARRFCKRIGAPVKGEPTLVSPKILGSSTPLYWQPCWVIAFPAQAKLQIDAATGAVQDYDNDALEILERTMPTGAAISGQQAIEIASGALLAAGQTEQLSLPSAEWHNAGGNGRAGCQWWLVRWDRMYQSVPYADQGVCVNVLPETGSVMGLFLNYYTPLPTSMAVNVTAAQAATIAEQQLVAEGNGDMALDTVDLRIVAIDSTPTSTTSPLVVPTARLAWVLEAQGLAHWRDLWVDCASGTIVGGFDSGLSGAPPAGGATAEIATALKGAPEVIISTRGARLEWVELAKWSAGSEGFGLVASASTTGVLPKPGLAPYELKLDSHTTLYYYPEKNLLGGSGCWLKVSPQLAVLVKNLPVPASPAPAKTP